jgi:hypothetical protein
VDTNTIEVVTLADRHRKIVTRGGQSPRPARKPRPPEHIWSLWKNGRRMDCGLYFHGESHGWECQLRDDGFLEFGQRFIFKEAALRFVGELRRDLEQEGWQAVTETGE